MDIDLAIQAVERIRDTLVEMDPENADDYRNNADGYIGTLRELDDEIAETLAGIPENQRYIVTFHDAYGYLASRYELTLLGFVVENPEAQPSAARYAELVDAIQELNVPYIYKEPQFDARVIEQLARDTGAQVRSIPSDALTDDAPDYVSLMRAIANGIAAD
jgi:ABC-type Zn uptake system ZnuABC Zn-binding protein ZnuA